VNITTVFIKRPVATTLLSLALVVAGCIAYALLPVSALPQVDFPTISVSASMSGASPKTMAASVATPLERAIGAIAGITEMTSVSTLGTTTVTVQFDLDRDINGAARDVQAAINTALGDLPSGLTTNPTYKLVNPADAPIMLVSLSSESMPRERLFDLASTLVSPKIAQVDGVGQVIVGGSALPAVRVAVNMDRLHQRGLSLEQVREAIAGYNDNLPQGALETDGRYWQIAVNSRARAAHEYAPLIVAWDNGNAVRLMDVATVTDSVQDVRNIGLLEDRPAVMLLIYRRPGANIIEAVDAVKATLPSLRELIPASVRMEAVFDRTITIRSSLHEVMRALVISVGLVVLVVFLFLYTARGTLIPGIGVGASIIGTFAGMYLCGFSLDNLSLMALAIATGFVVDDAIVVLENISRHLENGVPPAQAAIQGAREVSFTVFSISLSLIAVFIPILFMQGIAGRLFREFAATLSLAIAVSLLLSLTLTPMLCASLLQGKTASAPAPSALARHLAAFHAAVLRGYTSSLDLFLKHKQFVLILWFFITGLTVFLYIVTPKGFFPQQDTGLIRGALLADQSLSFQAMSQKIRLLMRAASSDPAVETVAGYTTGSTSAFIAIALKPRSQRDADADEVIVRLRGKVNSEPGAQLFLAAAQDINVGGRISRAMYQYTLQTEDLDQLRHWTDTLQRALKSDPLFKDLNSDFQSGGLESLVSVDRDTAARLGVTMDQVDAALNNAFGQRLVSTIYGERNQYRVVLLTEDSQWQGPEGLKAVYVPAQNGTLVPLSALASFAPDRTPVQVNHQGQSPAATISFNLDPGSSLSEATARIEAARRAIHMPKSVRASFQGTAKEFETSLRSQPWLIFAAIFCLYVVLGVLYESYVHPITILSTLPPAGIGALLALLLFGMDFSVIALIGVLLLAGIVKKNAILLIDFALTRRAEGMSAEESIRAACALRFRPIMMTTLAALLGAVPLAVGFGDGSELRRPLGVSIIGGLLMSQLLTLYTTPILYLYLEDLNTRWNETLQRLFKRPVEARTVATRLLPAVLLCCLASGCAVGPDYTRPATSVPHAYKEAGSDSVCRDTSSDLLCAPGQDRKSPAPSPKAAPSSSDGKRRHYQEAAHADALQADWRLAAPGSVDSGPWWEAFADPALNIFMRDLERSNQNIESARANLRQAQAQVREARAAFFPVLGGSGSISRGRAVQPPGVQTTYTATLQAGWELDLWGGTRRSVESAEAQAGAMAATLDAVILSMRAELALNYFQLRTFDAMLDLYAKTVAAYTRFLRITQNQYEAGTAARADVATAKAQLKAAEAQRVDLDVQRKQTEHAIALLLGLPASEFTLAPAPLKAQLPRIDAGIPSYLLERRPDVATAERQVMAANADIGVAKSAWFPSLTFPASGGYTSASFARWFTAPSEIWSFGPALALTLFQGGAIIAKTDQAEAAWEAAVANYRQTVLQAFADVEDALAATRLLEQEFALQEEALAAARDAEAMYMDQYQAGTLNYLNVATAQAVTLTNARTVEQLRGARFAALVSLIRALGGGW